MSIANAINLVINQLMKKLPILVFLFMWIPLLKGQQQNQVPSSIKESFINQYPGEPALWKKDGKFYKVSFNDPVSHLGQIIVYDENGNVVRKETEVESLEYPSNINTYYLEKYPGEKYKIWKTENMTGERQFYIDHKSQRLLFDSDGNIISDKKQFKPIKKQKP
jgi:hypothetical protein